MKIVIDIPRKIYERIRAEGGHECFNMWYDNNHIVTKAVYNGKKLPKGHGRIMDVDKVIKKMEEREEQLKDDRSIWETAGVETALDMFGETIIEADEAESEKEGEE